MGRFSLLAVVYWAKQRCVRDKFAASRYTFKGLIRSAYNELTTAALTRAGRCLMPHGHPGAPQAASMVGREASAARKRSKGARSVLLAYLVRGCIQLLRLLGVYHLLYVSALLRVRGAYPQA